VISADLASSVTRRDKAVSWQITRCTHATRLIIYQDGFAIRVSQRVLVTSQNSRLERSYEAEIQISLGNIGRSRGTILSQSIARYRGSCDTPSASSIGPISADVQSGADDNRLANLASSIRNRCFRCERCRGYDRAIGYARVTTGAVCSAGSES